MPYVPTELDSPFARLGGEAPILALVEAFYDAMSELEPALARLHPCDADGRVARVSRERFGLFFIGWLGGPQDYVARHGHPRLRRRHASVPVDDVMAAAWMRCMRVALDRCNVTGDVRDFLETRLSEVALFLRNQG